jgi:hypothetical protein
MASSRLQPDGKTGSTWSTDNCNMLVEMPESVVSDASQITEIVRTQSSSEVGWKFEKAGLRKWSGKNDLQDALTHGQFDIPLSSM